MEFNVAVVKLKYRALTFPNVWNVGTRRVLLSSRVLEFINFSLIMPFHSYLLGSVFHLIVFSCMFLNNVISTSLDTA